MVIGIALNGGMMFLVTANLLPFESLPEPKIMLLYGLINPVAANPLAKCLPEQNNAFL